MSGPKPEILEKVVSIINALDDKIKLLIIAIVIIVFYALFALARIQYSCSLIMFYVHFFVLIASWLTIIVLAIYCFQKRRWIYPIIIIIIIVCFVLSYKMCYDDLHERESKSIAAGNVIISALGEFYADSCLYPHSLESLVPQYLAAIPTPTTNCELQEFLYESRYGQTYYITFQLSESLQGVYYTEIGEWVIED